MMARETNDEARMTNNETNPNEQIIGRLCQFRTLSGFAEWRWRTPSDVDGQTGGEAKRERASQNPKMFRPSTFGFRH